MKGHSWETMILPSDKLHPLGKAKKKHTGSKHNGNLPHTLCPEHIFPPLRTLTKKIEKYCQSLGLHFHSSLFYPGTTSGLNVEGKDNGESILWHPFFMT